MERSGVLAHLFPRALELSFFSCGLRTTGVPRQAAEVRSWSFAAICGETRRHRKLPVGLRMRPSSRTRVSAEFSAKLPADFLAPVADYALRVTTRP